ncbi:PH domain-containing protein [Modestobacter sp. SYSU DS0511]
MTAPPQPEAPVGRRTSPRVLLVHTITFKQARSLVPVALAIAAGRGLEGGPRAAVVLVVGVTVLSLVWAALTWWRFTYTAGETSVVVTRGLVSRSTRTVPIDRIRGVEIETPPLHRLFGLVRVRIDAAAGAAGNDEELVVDGVPSAEGDRLREHLLSHRHAAPAVATGRHSAPEPAEEELLRLRPRWLLYAPLIGTYLVVPLAAVGALFRLVDELPDDYLPELTPDVEQLDVVDGWFIAAVVAGALLLLAVASVLGAAVVNWRFRLVRRGGSLVAERGLLTRRHTDLEVDRIRGCAVSDGLGMRLVGAARATALVTGLGDATRRGQLLPLGPRAQAWLLSDSLVPSPGPLHPHPKAALRRRVLRALVPGVVVLLAGVVLSARSSDWWPLVAVGGVLTVLAFPVARARYASLGHAAGGPTLAVRSGWLVREHVVLQRRAVVGWQVRQTFFQRRAGLATVQACVGAGSGGYAAVDMAADEAAGFAVVASGPWAGTLSR